MSALEVELSVCAGLFALGLSALGAKRSPFWFRLVYGGSALLSFVAVVVSLVFLLSDPVPLKSGFHLGLPWIGVQCRMDALGAFFLLVVNFGGAMASLYGVGYGAHEERPLRILPMYPVFLAAMNLVIVADDAFSFLFAWEFMSLSSWSLVLVNHRLQENRKAAFVYLVMASFGTMMLLFAFGIMAGDKGDYAFDTMRGGTLPDWGVAVVLVLTLLGAGSKAGLVPLHVWLPLAHPAAPSHVSALMSGVMTKVAVYAAMRILFDLSGPNPWWWSVPVMVTGGVTAFLGILYAIMQSDIKRFLAYSTVENIGIIFIGIGLAMAFQANGHAEASAVAMTAALFHTLNHSLFKNLLFMGAGAVLHATGLRDIERLGGLIHRMPRTAFLFLVGAVSISALPPFNGFASEWMTFQAILASPEFPQPLLKFLVPLVGAGLALTASLVATGFVKVYGTVFLGRPRTDMARNAHETDPFSLSAMAILAALCLLVGVVPTLVVKVILAVPSQLLGATLSSGLGDSTFGWMFLVPFGVTKSSYNSLAILFFVALSSSMAALFIHKRASNVVRKGPAWDCGFPDPSTMSQYTGNSFSQPIRRVFASVCFRAREKVFMPRPGDPRPASLTVTMLDPIWEFIFAPLGRFVVRFSIRADRMHFLTIRQFLSIMFAALILLLTVVAIWR
ncbi:MAG: hydrogenase 4 subunit B [Magnetococcales bacterium]|nr:hydrogenase 4 subunit B [Magnetococcales bacterium]MBF0322943.1 hydrogenase 4 subunit B [Magnetococcales bacterium]